MTAHPSAVDTATAGAAAREISALSWRVILLCSLVAFLDGFDTQLIGPAARSIASDLGFEMSAFGPIFSASQIGFLIGAMTCSALGDRLGRKRLLVVATLVFALCSLGTALAESYSTLFAFRLLAGVGLGGATPNFVSLASEFSLPALRARVVTMMWAAVPCGGMVGSFASSATIPSLGWRAMFFAGCAAPLLIVPLLLFLLPESRESQMGSAQHRAAPLELFAGKRAVATLWLWLASFMTWSVLVVVAFWTPPLLQRAGWSASTAATVLALNNGGGVIGTLIVGTLLTRVRPFIALIVVLAGAAVFILMMGAFTAELSILAPAAALAGFCCSAAGGALLAVAAGLYPGAARATGVGWSLGFGRIGSVIGPAAAGALVGLAWSVGSIYWAIAVPAVLAAVFIFLLSRTSAFAQAGVEQAQADSSAKSSSGALNVGKYA